MKKPELINAKQAVDYIADGSTLCTIGMTLISASETILKEIERRFLAEGRPNQLTYVHTCGQASMKMPGGMTHLAHEGLLKRVIGGHWGQSPMMMDLISNNQVEAFNLPQGQMANMFHSMALREPGKLSKIGIGTFVDPRIEGGKMNQRTKDCGDEVVAIVEIDGEEYIQYKPIPIDTLVIRGTYCDENGNLSTEEEGMMLEVLPAVMATKRWGGRVIAQVKSIVKNGTIKSKEVTVPGVLIDAVVVAENVFEEHRQTFSWYYDPAYCGIVRVPETAVKHIPLNERKVIGRRALMLLEPDAIINIGTGIPNDVVGPIMAEENVNDCVSVTVESGIYGGTPASTIDFGIACNAEALVGHDRQFELYTGAGIDFTFMGAGQLDRYGNVNATRMGNKATGAGGFIDITTTAKTVVFCSTFTGGGLQVSFSEETGVAILREGKFKKLVDAVQQISYNGALAVERGQKMWYVTERCVFELTAEGMKLVEIARGIDLERDILAQMDFKPLIAANLKTTDTRIYSESGCGLREAIFAGRRG
ncbi:MAG: acyl CoA:acetate/3-ketoacid CoA transferase [Eubacteriales bacterium]|nr:acyl CoA:acetate/3-ketoacid CoA transferase [Eubacteriales bacterium]